MHIDACDYHFHVKFCLVYFRSLKMGCPMHVRLALSPMGQHLVVAEKLSEHNHEIDRVRVKFVVFVCKLNAN